jgi:stage III sporulation protein AG
MKEKVFAVIKKMKREQWIVCGLAGILLLVIALPVKKSDAKEDTVQDEKLRENQESDIRQEYENQLMQALSQVAGVGTVQVAVTMESTGRKIVEKDSPSDQEAASQESGDGTKSSSQSSSIREETVFAENESGSQTPYISQETYPEIRGVLVIAEGGDDPVIVQQIQEAVMALFHVEAHKIKVLKMK